MNPSPSAYPRSPDGFGDEKKLFGQTNWKPSHFGVCLFLHFFRIANICLLFTHDIANYVFIFKLRSLPMYVPYIPFVLARALNKVFIIPFIHVPIARIFPHLHSIEFIFSYIHSPNVVSSVESSRYL